jgi:hypothetical protein
MIRFLEGGCDWGRTNLYFFAKVGLLAAINVAFLLSIAQRPVRLSAFLPHLVLLLAFALSESSDDSCDHYYAHPRLNMGQMGFEMCAFAILGMALVRVLRTTSVGTSLLVLILWNSLHVLTFYGWAMVWPYWSWIHVGAVTTTMLTSAGLILALSGQGDSPRRGPEKLLDDSLSRVR